MSSTQTPIVFVIGGTGAQGIPIIKSLVADKKYHCRILTRDTTSPRAQELLALGNVTLVEGTFANEKTLRDGFAGAKAAFINIDGFNCGEKTEIFWTIRAYELAIESRSVEFFVYGNLDYGLKKSGFDSKYRAGHYDGKGRIGEWILQQNKANSGRMKAALFTTGPYIEMTVSSSTPISPSIEDGVVTWRVPLGDGAVVHVALEDCGYYVRWLFDHQDRANGLDLEVAIAHIGYHELAKAFEKVTGHPAQYIDTDLETYWSAGPMSSIAHTGAAYNSDPNDPAFMSFKDNFTGFWNIWKSSGGNKGIIQRDYKFLDEIFPGRIKSAEEWFRREDEQGRKDGRGGLWERVQNLKPVLKISEDGRKGKL